MYDSNYLLVITLTFINVYITLDYILHYIIVEVSIVSIPRRGMLICATILEQGKVF